MTGEEARDHSRCEFRWRPVTCDRCHRAFVPRPGDDLHCTTEGDHCCTRCMSGESILSPQCPCCDARPRVVIGATGHCPTDACPVFAWDMRDSPLVCRTLALILAGDTR